MGSAESASNQARRSCRPNSQIGKNPQRKEEKRKEEKKKKEEKKEEKKKKKMKKKEKKKKKEKEKKKKRRRRRSNVRNLEFSWFIIHILRTINTSVRVESFF